mgnify:CR=1 FL=1
MDTSILISLAVPVFFLMIAIELVYGYASGKNNYRLNDSIAAISLGLISRIPPMLNLGVQGVVWASIANHYNLQLLPKESWITWFVAFVLYDVCYYWMHRMSHEIKILWAAHVVHHQGEEFNLSTALRQTSSGWLWKWIFYTWSTVELQWGRGGSKREVDLLLLNLVHAPAHAAAQVLYDRYVGLCK